LGRSGDDVHGIFAHGEAVEAGGADEGPQGGLDGPAGEDPNEFAALVFGEEVEEFGWTGG
jgi:hypothetical protein